MLVGAAYNAGKSVPDLMTEYGVKQKTILSHLFKYLQQGNPLERPDELLQLSALNEARRNTVFITFDQLGADRLGPIFGALNESVSYDELHLLRLVYLARKS
jgi:ATP-dependent DNA helicase RecQ